MPLSDRAGERLDRTLAAHRLVVFDLDGVLVDSNELKVECVREALAEFGPELVDPCVHEFRRTFGRSRREHFLAFHQDHLGGEQATGRDSRRSTSVARAVMPSCSPSATPRRRCAPTPTGWSAACPSGACRCTWPPAP
ncbi:HAD family hydrolase [Streptomyces malaysiensis]